MNGRVGTVAVAAWLAACAPPSSEPPQPPLVVAPDRPSVPNLPSLSAPRHVRVTVEASLDGREMRSERPGTVSVTLGFDAPPLRVVRVVDSIGTLDLERSDEGVVAVIDGARVEVTRAPDERPECEAWRITQEWPPGGALSATRTEDVLVLCSDATLVARERRTRFPLGERVEGWLLVE